MSENVSGISLCVVLNFPCQEICCIIIQYLFNIINDQNLLIYLFGLYAGVSLEPTLYQRVGCESCRIIEKRGENAKRNLRQDGTLTDKPDYKQTSRKDKQTSCEDVPDPSRQD